QRYLSSSALGTAFPELGARTAPHLVRGTPAVLSSVVPSNSPERNRPRTPYTVHLRGAARRGKCCSPRAHISELPSARFLWSDGMWNHFNQRSPDCCKKKRIGGHQRRPGYTNRRRVG